MSVENKINFAHCSSTQDFLHFSEENSIVERQSAEDFLSSNRDIPFVIRLCSYSNDAVNFGDNVYAMSRFYSEKSMFIHTLIRAELDSGRFFAFKNETALLNSKQFDASGLIWTAIGTGPQLCYFADFMN